MSKTDFNDNGCGLVRFPSISGFAKIILGMAAAALSTAALPAHAETVKTAAAVVDSDDDPYSDDLSLADRKVFQGEDATFSNLFSSWKRLDNGGMPAARASVYIPTGRPVDKLKLTSNYGARSDPFVGRTRMHKGIDIPGPVGTPIYATADGIVSRSQWVNGYGNLVEIAHGNDTETRYGHLSKLLVEPNSRVRRGQLIGLMGSTGRSTGSHLHYEIRIAGNAINPLPFVTGSERAMALNTQGDVAVGGPTSREEKIASK
ncbi:MAG: M23 family metallopeptidase [Sphingobium sp.]